MVDSISQKPHITYRLQKLSVLCRYSGRWSVYIQGKMFASTQQNKIVFFSKRAVYTKYCHCRTHTKLMNRICLSCRQMVVYIFGTPYLLVFWCFRPDFILNIIYLKTGHVNSALPPPQQKHAFWNFSLRFLNVSL